MLCLPFSRLWIGLRPAAWNSAKMYDQRLVSSEYGHAALSFGIPHVLYGTSCSAHLVHGEAILLIACGLLAIRHTLIKLHSPFCLHASDHAYSLIHLSAVYRSDGRQPRIYLKREDLNHTGAHKINNALGQALLCRKMGKRQIVAETGAGQHGVATVSHPAPLPPLGPPLTPHFADLPHRDWQCKLRCMLSPFQTLSRQEDCVLDTHLV